MTDQPLIPPPPIDDPTLPTYDAQVEQIRQAGRRCVECHDLAGRTEGCGCP